MKKRFYTIEELAEINSDAADDLMYDIISDAWTDYFGGAGEHVPSLDIMKQYFEGVDFYSEFDGVFFDEKGNDISLNNSYLNALFSNSSNKVQFINTDAVLTDDIVLPEDTILIIQGNLYGNDKNISCGMLMCENIEDLKDINAAKIICKQMKCVNININPNICFRFSENRIDELNDIYIETLGIDYVIEKSIRKNQGNLFLKEKLNPDIIVGNFWVDELEESKTHRIKTVFGFNGGEIEADNIKNAEILSGNLSANNLENCSILSIKTTGDKIINSDNFSNKFKTWEFDAVEYASIKANIISTSDDIKGKKIEANRIITSGSSQIVIAEQIKCSTLFNSSLIYAKEIDSNNIVGNDIISRKINAKDISGIYLNCKDIYIKDSFIMDKINNTHIHKMKDSTYLSYNVSNSNNVDISVERTNENG